MTKIPTPQSPKQEMMLNSQAQITVVGGAAGSGKSYVMTMHPLKYIHDSKYNAVFFRRNTKQVIGQGGLYDTAKDIYSELPKDIRPRFKDGVLKAIFPSGANIQWNHLEHENDKISHQGLQYSAIYFDEGTHFTATQVEYLMSRLRSGAENESYMYISCNPDPDCEWLLEMVEWYLDEEGYPDPLKDGVIRWFITIGGKKVWGDTREELIQQYGEDFMPLSFTFISAVIYDNPVMLKTNPSYLAFLKGLNDVDRARLLDGNWYARPEGSNFFKREWCAHADGVPEGSTCARAWDKASQEPSDVYKYPDYTASFKMYKDRQGFFYIVGDYCLTNKDKDSNILGRFRCRPGERDRKIQEQAEADGQECTVVFSVDPGAAGKTEYLESAKKLIAEGFVVKPDPMPPNKSKVVRFSPFASACENGFVYIVPSSFPNKETLEHVLKELEAFNGERSTATRKDDIPDGAASCFNALAKERVIPRFSLSYSAPSTMLENLK